MEAGPSEDPAAAELPRRVGRRADLTFRYNRELGRHGWLRLTPAYSVRVVENLLAQMPQTRAVLDPFSGTGTTALCAMERGLNATAVELNPFLVWLATVKTRTYRGSVVGRARATANRALERLPHTAPRPAPPIHRIDRWWSAEVLEWLCQLHAALPERGQIGDLLRVAFYRTMMQLSGAAFNHPSMSFGGTRDVSAEAAAALYRDDVEHVLGALADSSAFPPRGGSASIVAGDARSLPVGERQFDAVITSPPYPNRMSYVRELRPYMYWSGHLQLPRDAGELDWKAIGGTWGIATSRLKSWERKRARPRGLRPILKAIAAASDKNGPLLAAYVDRYFEDMDQHFEALRPRVRSGGELAYVIGNASFYGVLVPAERFFEALMRRHGFRNVRSEVLRKRNSNKKLFELIVRARG